MTKARFQFKFLRLKINFWWFRLVSVLAKGSGQRFWPKVLAKGSGQFQVSVLDLNQKPDLGRTLPQMQAEQFSFLQISLFAFMA